MRVAVVGLGGVGGYIAACLAKTEHEVLGFARGEHLHAIEQRGLEIVEDDSSWHVALEVHAIEEIEGYFDVVLFCLKSYDLSMACKAFANHLHKDSIAISFANGVNSVEVLRNSLDVTVLDGCVYILSHIEKAGIIRKKGKVFAAVFGGDSDATQILAQLFDAASLRYKTPEDIRTAVWKKYIFISAFATLTSYYDTSIGAIYEKHFEEAKELLQEIANVAHAMNIDIYDEVEKSLETAKNVPYDSSTSMHLDFTNNKATELGSLSGYIVSKGLEYGVDVSLMQKFYQELKQRG